MTDVAARPTTFRVNGREVAVDGDPMRRLSEVLRDDLGLTGTKVGCDAGDCGACTVRLDGDPVCACLVPLGQLDGRDGRHRRGPRRTATPCGRSRPRSCGPARRNAGSARRACSWPPMPSSRRGRTPPRPRSWMRSAASCAAAPATARSSRLRSTLAATEDAPLPPSGAAVGCADRPRRRDRPGHRHDVASARIARPSTCSICGPSGRRMPTHGSRSATSRRSMPPTRGSCGCSSPPTCPARTSMASMPPARTSRSSPTGTSAIRGEAVAALVGDAETIARIDDGDLPIEWQPLEPILDPAAAAAPGATQFHDAFPGNVLTSGRVARGDVETGLAASTIVATGTFQTSHLEHAYIEPEAGFARRDGDRIEVVASTQTPYMDRDEIALILGLAPDRVRVVPTACGGGFGGKLDLSLQPLIAVAAWLLDRAVRCVYTRPESMRSTTKRHPARMTASLGADADGRFTALAFHGDFDTGRVRLVGPDGRQPRPGACLGAVRGAGRSGDDPGDLHERPDLRRVPWFRRAPGRDRGRGARRRRRGGARHRSPRDPAPQRAARRIDDGDRPGARRERRVGALPRGAPPGLGRGDGGRAAPQSGRRRRRQPDPSGHRHRGDVVRHRQHVAAQIRPPSGSACGPTGRTSCSAAPRTSGRARTRS